MVQDVGALRRARWRTSGAGVGGHENAPPGAAARPPLRPIQASASGAPRWSLPAHRTGSGVRVGKAPPRVGLSTSLALRKPGAKLVGRSGLKTEGTSSVEEPRNKVRDAISFWEENSGNVKNVSSTLRQYDSHAPAKVEDCSDEDFVKLHLELDIFKTILVAAHAEVEQRMTDELKASRYVIQDLESELVRSIKSNDQSLELIHKRDMEISRLNSELDILHRREYLVTEEHKIQTLQLYDAEDSPLSAKLKRIEASLEKAHDLNTRYQQDLESHSSAEEEKDEVRRQAEVETVKVITSLQLQLNASKKNELLAKENLEELQLEKNRLNDRLGKVMEENERFSSVNYELSTDNSLLQSKLTRSEEVAKALSFDLRMVWESASIAKDKADELIKVKESVILLEQELASKSQELDDVVSDRQQFKDQIMKNNGRVAALEKELAKKIDELDMISSENAELKSQLKRTERISPIVEELAHRSKFTGKLEEELRSLQNELSKLSDEKHSCEAQLLFFKDKLEMAQALTAESESIATKAQQIVKEKKNEIKLLERSVEDLEITVCELENKVSIVKEEAKHEKMQREELELKLQSIRQQKSVMQSFGNASSSLKDEMVSLVDSMRHSQDKQNELLDAQEVSKSEQEVLGPVQKDCASCMSRGKQCVGMTQPFEELMQGAKASNGEYRANGCSSGDTWNGSTNASFPYSHALPKTTNQTKPTVQATESPTVGAEPAPLTEDPDELSKESSLVEGLQELKETDDEMEDTHSSAEDYRPKISEFDQPSPNEHLQQYSGSEQPELHKVGVVSDQSQSESRSEEQLPSPFVGPVVEIIEENELPPFAPMRHNDPVNYMRAPSDELKRLRSRNHYEGQRTATDRRFWSIEQQDLYTSIYSRAKLVDMKWIDWEHIDSEEMFAGVRKRCAHLGLEKIMEYGCDWDDELIRQFYSTVYISADKTSLTWMTDGRKITTNKSAWEEKFSIPSSAHTEIHSELFLNDDNKSILYTAAEYTLGRIKGLSPLASIANKILRTTIYPRFGNTTHSWNVLYHIVEQQSFDIISLIFGEISLRISDHNRIKDQLLYAPYIMGMIMRAFEYKGPNGSTHDSYKPRPPYKRKLPPKARPSVAGATPAVVSPLEPTISAVQREVAAAGREAHVEEVDNHHQSEAAGHQPQVQGVQRRAVLVQPIRHTDLFQVVESGLKPIRDTLASMEGRIGRVEEGAYVVAQRISSSSSQILASSSSPAPLPQTTSAAPPQAPATSHFSEQANMAHADNLGVSAQPVHVRPSPFSGFRWYEKK